MAKEDLIIIMSNYITIHNTADSDIFLNTVEKSEIDKSVGRAVVNYMRRRKVDDAIYDISVLVNDINQLEDVYENVEGFVWNNELITKEIYDEKMKHRMLYANETFFLETKEEEISSLIELIQLKSQYVKKEYDVEYRLKRDKIISDIIKFRSKFVYYKQNLAKSSLDMNIPLDIEKFEGCGIYFKENMRNDDTGLKVDYRELKEIIETLHKNHMLLETLTEDQKEVASIELLSPAFFTKLKDKEMMEEKYGAVECLGKVM